MKKLLILLALTFGLTYSVNSNASEKVDLIFCASDMTKYFDPRYSEPYLRSSFGGKCPRSKPFEITYNQMREKVSSNYKLYIDSNKSVYFSSRSDYGNYMREIKYDGRNFYVSGGTTKSNTYSSTTSKKSKSGFQWWYLLAIPLLGGIVQAFDNKDKDKRTKTKTSTKENKSTKESKEEQTSLKFTGTAFFINLKGHLITNFHVVANSGNRLKIIYDGEEITARIIAKDETLDLALVKVSAKNENYIEISDTSLEKMQSIVAAGYPALNLSDDLKLTSGIISSLKGIGNNSALIQIDAALNPGNSGGPIIDKDNGHLAAVAVSGMRGSDYQSINYGIKASRVKEFIESNSVVVPKKSLNSKKLKRKEISEILESSTVLIFH